MTDRELDAPEAADFASFFRDNYTRVVAFLMYQGCDQAAAEDAAQDAFAVLYSNWNRIPEIKYRAAYVRKVALNALRRTKVREHQHDQLPDELELSDSDPDPVEPHYVLQLIRSLPVLQRTVIALSMDGIPTAQIADFLQIQPSTVRSHLRFAREALREKLAKEQL